MSKPLSPSRTAPQFVVRFPDDAMRDRVKAMAEQAGRSMNAQIVFMIQDYFDDVDREAWQNSPEYWEQMRPQLDEIEKERSAVAIPVRPKSAAIRVAEMTREQKQAFIASIDRSLEAPGTSDAERSMLIALRNAAQEEVAVIDKQLKQLK